MTLEFHDVRFPEDVSWGSRGGPEFRTQIFQSHKGWEKRNIDWAQPLMRFNAAYGVKTDAQMQAVINFYIAREGMAHGFRYKNWADYQVINDTVALGDGTNKRLKLYKKLTVGGATMYKRLWKIVKGSVTGVTLDAVPKTEGTDFAIDYNSGEIIFTSIPTDNAVVAVTTLEFDEPVRFDFDDLQVVIDAYNNQSLNQLPLIGYRGTFTSGQLFEPGGSTPGTDGFYSFTKLVLLFDDADGATSTTDFSPQALTVTFNGDASITRSASQHGHGSLSPGTTGSVSVPGASMQMGLSPFTIELFARKPTSGANMQPLISQWNEGSDLRGWALRYNYATDRLQFAVSYDGASEAVIATYPWDTVDNTFFDHISIERMVNGWYIFRINGEVLQMTRSLLPLFPSSANVHVGTYADTPSGTGPFQELIDAVRVTVGRARYNTFTDESVPLPYPTA